ncbi:MAG: GH32 C-terminal domain-containing protein [Clostridia bacterium]|nr:GH32 C-terminal domain-containing protein [Clostridia bacterium]
MIKENNSEFTDYAELWRPQYHYSSLDCTVNDPNGLVYYNGVYHLYYQCIPHFVNQSNPRTADYLNRFRQMHSQGTRQGKHWGHATSADLIHWQEAEVALFPDDVGHMWSGTAVVDVKNSSGFFTNTQEKQGIVVAYSTNTQHIGIAYSVDDGKTFNKVSTTVPVIKNPGIGAFRDPHIFWHEETNSWKMVVAGKTGKMWIYQAKDLLHWELCSVDDQINTECPNLFRMAVEGSTETKWILSCVGRGYYVGDFDGMRFIPQTEYITMNEGPDCYAGITFANLLDNRTVMISWVNAYNCIADGKWNGGFTIPVDLKLVKTDDSSYRLMQSIVPEFSVLKKENLVSVKQKQYEGGKDPLIGISSNCFDLYAEIDVEKSDSFSIVFCKSNEEETLLCYDKTTCCLSVDRHKSSKFGCEAFSSTDAFYSFYIEPKTLRNGMLTVRLLVDVSNMELFVNDGYYYFVARIQPFTSSKAMSISYEGSITLNKLTVDECGSIWFADGESRGAVHISDDTLLTVVRGCTNSERMVAELCGREVCCGDFDPSVAKVEIENNTLKVTGISEGKTSVKLYCGEYYRILNIAVIAKEERAENTLVRACSTPATVFPVMRNIATVTHEYSGRISVQKFGGERGFIVVDNAVKDFLLSTKAILFGHGAAGILFRTVDGTNFLCAEIDSKDNVVKLWKKMNGEKIEISSVSKSFAVNTVYEIRVESEDESIKVYVDNVLAVEGKDDMPVAGKIGIVSRMCDVAFDGFTCN